jgi:hypothetical protein
MESTAAAMLLDYKIGFIIDHDDIDADQSYSFEPFEDLLTEGVLHAVLVLVDHLPLELLLGQVFLGD